MDPFRVAADASPRRPRRRRRRPPPRPPATPPAAARAASAEADDECPDGTICETGVCAPVETRDILVLLFRKEGAFTALHPVLLVQQGHPGYPVVAPFYWHFWSPEGKTRSSPRSTGASRTTRPSGWSRSSRPTRTPGSPTPSLGGLAAVLRLDQVRLGGAAAAARSRSPTPTTSGSFGAVRASCTAGSATAAQRVRPAFPLFVSTRRPETQLHLGAAAELLLAHRQRPATCWCCRSSTRSWHPNGGTFATWLGYHRRERRPATGLAALALLGRRERRRPRPRYDVLFPLLWCVPQRRPGTRPSSSRSSGTSGPARRARR